MGEDSKSAKTQILIATISLVGVLGAALLANWDKIFPSRPPTLQDNLSQKPSTSDQHTTAQQTTPMQTTPQQKAPRQAAPVIDNKPTVADAERLTVHYFNAFRQGDVNSLMEMISDPFFVDSNFVSKDQVRMEFEREINKTASARNLPPVAVLKGQTVADFKAGGGPRGDRALSSLRMEDSDFVVSANLEQSSYFWFFFRPQGSSLRMVGLIKLGR
jgi:hypothetical protein